MKPTGQLTKTPEVEKVEKFMAEQREKFQAVETLTEKLAAMEENGVNKTDLEAVKTEMKSLCDNIKTIDDAIKAIKDRKLPGAEGTGKDFSLFRAAKAIKMLPKVGPLAWDKAGAGLEKEIFEATAKAFDTSDGTYIIPTETATEIIEFLRGETVLNRLGIRILPNIQGGMLELPRMTGGALAYWTSEGSAITDTTKATFDQLQLTPHAAASLMPLTNRALAQITPEGEAMLRQDFGQALAELIDKAGLRGNGSGETPTGLLNISNVLTLDSPGLGTNGGDFTFDHTMDLERLLADNNTLRGSLAYCFHPRIKIKLRKQKIDHYSAQATNQAYLMGPPNDANLAAWLNYPFQTTTLIPVNGTKAAGTDLTEIYFGNWRDFIMATWGGLRLDTSEHLKFDEDKTVVRIIQEVDFAVRHPESFVIVNDANSL